jgi:hypothetical protein
MLESRACRGRRIRRLIVLVGLALALLVPVTAAHAEWYFTQSGAQRIARDYVSRHYADTYYSDITAVCRPQGDRYDPTYKYHRWVCGWYDSSDGTKGAVLVAGSSGSGSYFAKVLRGAH